MLKLVYTPLKKMKMVCTPPKKRPPPTLDVFYTLPKVDKSKALCKICLKGNINLKILT